MQNVCDFCQILSLCQIFLVCQQALTKQGENNFFQHSTENLVFFKTLLFLSNTL